MKPSGKTPYEIRLELLQLAQEILSDQHRANSAAAASATTEWVQPTTAATTEQIIAEAEKMNSFISKANQHG